MALQRSGIELIVKNFRGFVSSIGKANKAYQKLGKESTKAAKSVNRAGNIVKRAQSQVVVAQKKAENAQSRLHKELVKHIRSSKTYSQKLKENAKEIKKLASQQKQNADTTKAINALNKKRVAMLALMADSTTKVHEAQNNLIASKEQLKSATNSLIEAEEKQEAIAIETADSFELLSVAGITASTSIVAIGVAIGVAYGAFKIFQGILSRTISMVKSLTSTVLDLIRRALNPLADIARRVFGRALGIGIGGVFRDLSQTIGTLLDDLGRALSLFQRLDIQYEALAARDISKEQLIPMADAFQKASVRAESLLSWIKQIAVTTPFSVENLSQTIAMANAMGLNIEQAKSLTLAVGDFVAAMGLTEDHMFRIIYNFGQMLSQGKLNGREFRDLANSFVPVWEMMRRMGEQAGMTAQEFKELAFEGAVPVEAFFNEFIKMAEEDFPGAMEKMARTLAGVTNNIKDFIDTVLGIELLGPVFDKLTALAADALDKLLSPNIRRAAEFVGKALSKAFDKLVPTVEAFLQSFKKVGEALGLVKLDSLDFARAIAFVTVLVRRLLENLTAKVEEWAANIGGSFDNVRDRAYSWGYNIVAMLAKGMSAAIRLITMVISVINRILSYWLSPSSPPRVAPELDRWGAAAMTEYLRGWLSGDFSVFNEIADMVESYLRAMSFRIGETALIPRILGARETIARLINQVRDGLISVADAARRVQNRIKGLSQEFRAYIVALFDVAEAEKAVAEAQERVAEAQEVVERLNLRVAEAQEVVEAITLRLADAQGVLEAATARVRAEQEALRDVSEKYSAILDDLNRQLRGVTEEYDDQQRLAKIQEALNSGLLTAAEKERLEMEKRSLLLKQQIREVEDQRDAEEAAVKARIDAAEEAKREAQARVDAIEQEREAAQREVELRERAVEAAQREVEIRQKAVEAAEKELEAAQKALEAAEAIIEVQIKQNELIAEQIALLESLAETGGEGAEDLTEMFEDLGGSIASVSETADALSEHLKDVFDEIALEGIFDDAEGLVDDFLESMTPLAELFKPIETDLAALESTAKELWSTIGLLTGTTQDLESWQYAVKGVEPPPVDTFIEGVKTMAEKLGEVNWVGVTDAIVSIAGVIADVDWIRVGEGIAAIADGLSNILIFFADFTEMAAEEGILKTAATGVVNIFKIMLTDIEGVYETEGAAAAKAYEDSLTKPIEASSVDLSKFLVGNSLFPEMMSSIYDIVTTGADDTSTYWETVWGDSRTFLQGVADDVGLTIVPTMMSNVLTEVTTKLGETTQNWLDKWGEKKAFLVDEIVPTIESLITDTLTSLRDFLIDDVGGGIQNLIDDYLTPLRTWFEDTLTTALDNFRTGPLASIKSAFDRLKGAVEKVAKFLANVRDILNSLSLAKLKIMFGGDGGGKAMGGPVLQGQRYMVGEHGPEMFVPFTNGFILPNWFTQKLLAPPVVAGGGSSVTNVNMEINPTYKNVQSEASLFYDATAALAAARL